MFIRLVVLTSTFVNKNIFFKGDFCKFSNLKGGACNYSKCQGRFLKLSLINKHHSPQAMKLKVGTDSRVISDHRKQRELWISRQFNR